MKPTEIVMDALYRNSKYPETVYKGVLAPDGRLTFKILKSEDAKMIGTHVFFNETIPLNQDFWALFSPIDSADSADTKDMEYESIPVHDTPRNKKELVLLDGEFSVKDLAEKNGVEYPIASVFLKAQLAAGVVHPTREERRNPKGPMTQLFSKIALTPSLSAV